MKRTVFLIMIFTVIFCACVREGDEKAVSDRGSGAVASGTETIVSSSGITESAVSGSVAEEEDGSDSSSGINVIMAKKDGPMLSERIDPTRKGIEMFNGSEGFATGPVIGDDGNCYYYRKERKKGGKVIFYRNNGIKVCETVLPEKYEKDYYISVFYKQGARFWIRFSAYEFSSSVLVPLGIKDGKWGKGIKVNLADRFIYYKGRFYSSAEYGDGMITIIDQKGNARRIEYEGEGKQAILQTIIDDKLYYTTNEEETWTCTVMRCDMDGGNKEELFRYDKVCGSDENHYKLILDGDFFYLFDTECGSMLTRVPLYTKGEAEEIIETDWFQLTGDSIYYWDKTGISRVDKELKGRQESVIRLNRKRTGKRFFCADGHILVEVHDKEESKKLEAIWLVGIDKRCCDIGMNYASGYYWISEKGKVDDRIPGSGFFKKYQEWYESAAEYLEKYGSDDEYD